MSMIQLNNTNVILCNDGSAPLRVPGFFDVDYRYELPFESRFSTPFDDSFNPNVTAREIAVLRAIDCITDKDDWDSVVLRDDCPQIGAWYAEAQASSSLINEDAWTWIVRELRDKAQVFLTSSSVLVFDTGAVGMSCNPGYPEVAGFGVCKSDSRALSSLSIELQQGIASFFEPKKIAQAGLTYQVDPSMFPLVYDRTPVLTRAGETITLHGRLGTAAASYQGRIRPATLLEREKIGPGSGINSDTVQSYSNTFQWLPCEVEFRGGVNVAITSYINNLHPDRFQHLYCTIEKIISAAIEPWNQVLVKAGRGRTPLRILTFGVEYSPRRLYRNLPWVRNIDLLDNDQIRASAVDYIEKYEALPGHQRLAQEQAGLGANDRWKDRWRVRCNESGYTIRLWKRWSQSRTLPPDKHPQIGQTLTYDAWKAGDSGACVVPPMRCEDVMSTSVPDYDFRPQPVVLQDMFGRQGLQVVVKLASVELTPTEPWYAGSDWGVQGAGNEHIVAVAVLYYSVENVDARVAFLHNGGWDISDYDYDYFDFSELAQVIAIDTGDTDVDEVDDSVPYDDGQRLGAVSARQGRLLAYPNHLLSRLEPLELQDKTKPGHLRSLVLCLVDPHYRICSTRNVAPQQPEYWFNEAFQAVVPKSVSLPLEIKDLILEYAESWPMTTTEAIELSQQERALQKSRNSELWGPCTC